LKRFGAEAERVIARGEQFRLVEAGNHCQDANFAMGRSCSRANCWTRSTPSVRTCEGFS
jgi:hypothetical protein